MAKGFTNQGIVNIYQDEMNQKSNPKVLLLFFLFACFHGLWHPCQAAMKPAIQVEQVPFQVPVLIGKPINPILRIKITVNGTKNHQLMDFLLQTQGTTDIQDLQTIAVYYTGKDTLFNKESKASKRFGKTAKPTSNITIDDRMELQPGVHYFWITCQLADQADLLHKLAIQLADVHFSEPADVIINDCPRVEQRIGAAVQQHMENGIHTARIPGLAVTPKGTLLAIFDARRQSARDLQGDIDIGLRRSTDGGQTWQPLEIAMDMGEWGGLPEKFNGVSDPCILVDKNSNTIYIAALWMHGVINQEGNWLKGLNENSEDWNHQWKNKGSQPGFGVKQTSQFMLVKSTDDGKTWSKPLNITKMCKEQDWWLFAPAPGNGIVLNDGTLVFPTQGRDASGRPFSTITYSKDSGRTWQTGKRALDKIETTECAVVQLADQSLMLNMRANKNKGKIGPENGRAVCVTRDMGKTWTEHPSSFNALPEPVCMASLYKHSFMEAGKQQHFLLFSNPNSKVNRDHLTIKVSADDGQTWPQKNWVLLDEWKSRGYSCITSVDEQHVGILYESSQADMVFQKIALSEWLEK